MMKFLAFLFLLLTSLNSQANGLKELLQACEASTQIDVCNNLKNVKKNVESEAKTIISNYNLENPLAASAFLINPEIKFNHKNHNFKIRLNSSQIIYSYNF